jgi:glycosyltransferase involved in cell wall biosynthesis
MHKISVVSPIYNGQECIEELVKKIKFYIEKCTKNFEIILIDDASNDNSWSIIKKLKKKYKYIKGVKLKKNYGQHKAIYIGLKYSIGNIIIIMDSDLQDNPKYILKFYKEFKRHNLVIGINKHKKINFMRIYSNVFWIILTILSFINFKKNISNYLITSREIVDRYLNSGNIGFFYAELKIMKLKIKYIKIERSKRYCGKSSYDFIKCFKLATKHILEYNIINKLFFSKFIRKYYNNNKTKILISQK